MLQKNKELERTLFIIQGLLPGFYVATGFSSGLLISALPDLPTLITRVLGGKWKSPNPENPLQKSRKERFIIGYALRLQ